ncbi:MAG: ABC transporter substrate-binding protein [Anaerolineae bacterium]|nr:ABC transporter substrate-binding protein [Anaerolineae bacterium]
MKHKKSLVLGMVILLALGLVAPGLSTAQDDALKIGVLTDHAGALSVYGFEQTQGFELGLEYATDGSLEVAGRPIELVVRDNAGDIDQAIEDARELIEEEGVEVLFGSPSSTVTLNLMATAAEYEVVMLAGPAATPAITGEAFNEYTFRACRNSFHDAYTAATFALESFGGNYVQFAPDNAFGTGSAVAFDVALQSVGATPHA